MPTTATQKEFVIPLENKPGALAEVTTALGKANVNVLGYSLGAQGEFGVFRFTTSDPAKTEGWLKQSSRAYRASDVLTVNAPNNPGELGRIAAMLAKSGVNINASYPASVGTNVGILLAVNDITAAKKVLGS
jgi:hypothetical protein